MTVASSLTSVGAWPQSDGTPHMTDINHDFPQLLQDDVNLQTLPTILYFDKAVGARM
jgi:hypothetical protein